MSVPRPIAHGAASYPTDARTRALPPAALCPLLPLLPRLDGAVVPFLLSGCVLLCAFSVVWPGRGKLLSGNPAADDIPMAGVEGNFGLAADDIPTASVLSTFRPPTRPVSFSRAWWHLSSLCWGVVVWEFRGLCPLPLPLAPCLDVPRMAALAGPPGSHREGWNYPGGNAG